MSAAPAFESDLTTYRGGSLEEVLPRIREELGSDAVIVRQREGILGGIGGFFGRRCVEVDARAAVVRPALPPRRVVDAYDAVDRPAEVPPLLETLMAQASPFAERLDEALSSAPEPEPLPEPALLPVPLPEAALSPLPARVAVAGPPSRADEVAAVRVALLKAGVPQSLAEEIVREADDALRPFDPFAPFARLARRALARRIDVRHGWRTKRRTIAVVGLPGAGRTLAAAKLCSAYASAGRAVGALSLESSRAAVDFADRTADIGVAFESAGEPELVARARRALRGSEIVVVDTPPLAAAVGGAISGETLRLLAALKPNELHLLLPVRCDLAVARDLLATLQADVAPSHLLLTHADVQTANGAAVGLSLAGRIPISFVGEGARTRGGLRAVEPDDLARMVLP